MNQAPRLTHYRLDELPLVLGLLMQMNLPQIYDREIRDHLLHTGLSGGWMMTIWLAFLITRGDHTKYNVEAWVARHQEVIAKVTGQVGPAGGKLRRKAIRTTLFASNEG